MKLPTASGSLKTLNFTKVEEISTSKATRLKCKSYARVKLVGDY